MADHSPANSESLDTALARNLVVARTLLGFTQDALSAASGISRATIAQLESGYSDPRVSTIEALAKVLHLTPSLLLLKTGDVRTMGAVKSYASSFDGLFQAHEIRRFEAQLSAGAIKNQLNVAEAVAAVLKDRKDLSEVSAVLGALLAAILPDPGVSIGIALGMSEKPPAK